MLLNFRMCPYFNLLTPTIPLSLVLVSATVSPDTTLSVKKGRLKRMLPTCQANIVDMSATDRDVCCLGGVANRHKPRHCQPSIASSYSHADNDKYLFQQRKQRTQVGCKSSVLHPTCVVQRALGCSSQVGHKTKSRAKPCLVHTKVRPALPTTTLIPYHTIRHQPSILGVPSKIRNYYG